jgi:hypothetical protein
MLLNLINYPCGCVIHFNTPLHSSKQWHIPRDFASVAPSLPFGVRPKISVRPRFLLPFYLCLLPSPLVPVVPMSFRFQSRRGGIRFQVIAVQYSCILVFLNLSFFMDFARLRLKSFLMAIMTMTSLYGRTAVRPYSDLSGCASRRSQVYPGQEWFEITAVQDNLKRASWTRRMRDFGFYCFENEVLSI